MGKIFIFLTFLTSSFLLFIIPYLQEELGIAIFTDFSYLVIYLLSFSIILPLWLSSFWSKKYQGKSFIKLLSAFFIIINLVVSSAHLYWLLSTITPGF